MDDIMNSISYMMANHDYEAGDASVNSAVVLLQRIVRGHLTRKKLHEARELYNSIVEDLDSDNGDNFMISWHYDNQTCWPRASFKMKPKPNKLHATNTNDHTVTQHGEQVPKDGVCLVDLDTGESPKSAARAHNLDDIDSLLNEIDNELVYTSKPVKSEEPKPLGAILSLTELLSSTEALLKVCCSNEKIKSLSRIPTLTRPVVKTVRREPKASVSQPLAYSTVNLKDHKVGKETLKPKICASQPLAGNHQIRHEGTQSNPNLKPGYFRPMSYGKPLKTGCKVSAIPLLLQERENGSELSHICMRTKSRKNGIWLPPGQPARYVDGTLCLKPPSYYTTAKGNTTKTANRNLTQRRNLSPSLQKSKPLSNWPRSGIVKQQSTICQTSPQRSPARSVQSESCQTSPTPSRDSFIQSPTPLYRSASSQSEHCSVQTFSVTEDVTLVPPRQSVNEIGIQTDYVPPEEKTPVNHTGDQNMSDLAPTGSGPATSGDICQFITPNRNPAIHSEQEPQDSLLNKGEGCDAMLKNGKSDGPAAPEDCQLELTVVTPLMSPSKPATLDEYEGDSISSTPRPAADSLSDLSIPAVDKLSAHVQAISTPLTANSATSCTQQPARESSHVRASSPPVRDTEFEQVKGDIASANTQMCTSATMDQTSLWDETVVQAANGRPSGNEPANQVNGNIGTCSQEASHAQLSPRAKDDIPHNIDVPDAIAKYNELAESNRSLNRFSKETELKTGSTHEELKSHRDNVCMELMWIEEAISSRKQYLSLVQGMGDKSNK